MEQISSSNWVAKKPDEKKPCVVALPETQKKRYVVVQTVSFKPEREIMNFLLDALQRTPF